MDGTSNWDSCTNSKCIAASDFDTLIDQRGVQYHKIYGNCAKKNEGFSTPAKVEHDLNNSVRDSNEDISFACLD